MKKCLHLRALIEITHLLYLLNLVLVSKTITPCTTITRNKWIWTSAAKIWKVHCKSYIKMHRVQQLEIIVTNSQWIMVSKVKSTKWPTLVVISQIEHMLQCITLVVLKREVVPWIAGLLIRFRNRVTPGIKLMYMKPKLIKSKVICRLHKSIWLSNKILCLGFSYRGLGITGCQVLKVAGFKKL